MFRIRRIYDDAAPANRTAIATVQQILRDRFPLLHPDEVDHLPEKLKNPLKYRFRSILFVADVKRAIRGFALLMHASDLNFCFLDFISTAQHQAGRGLGSALYDRIREEAARLGCRGLFFECLPDDSALCADPEILRQNARRLKFYEAWGARPLANTRYETPVRENDDNPPFLVIDTLGRNATFTKEEMQAIIRAILERKYPDVCDRKYVRMVVDSITDDPVQLRPFRYVKKKNVEPVKKALPEDQRIGLVYSANHQIHHVRERGYVESPVRVKNILKHLERSDLFSVLPVRHFADDHITAVHDKHFVRYLQAACASVPENESIYPYVFPIRNSTRPPKSLPMRAGYYCIDTFTPLNRSAYAAARHAVDCVLTGADDLLEGRYLAYALVRPPGHHAETSMFGGFCYFNSAAIAAHYLSRHGRVAILDIDYHHGNGQQEIFYRRADVFTLSIHGHPRFTYPFFSGFAEETGEAAGKGFNLNLPLPENSTAATYLQAIKRALNRLRAFAPQFVVVALGFDTAKGDPTGTWPLDAADYEEIGDLIGSLPHATLFVQEGGYNTRTLGKNAARFFAGVWKGSFT